MLPSHEAQPVNWLTNTSFRYNLRGTRFRGHEFLNASARICHGVWDDGPVELPTNKQANDGGFVCVVARCRWLLPVFATYMLHGTIYTSVQVTAVFARSQRRVWRECLGVSDVFYLYNNVVEFSVNNFFDSRQLTLCLYCLDPPSVCRPSREAACLVGTKINHTCEVIKMRKRFVIRVPQQR